MQVSDTGKALLKLQPGGTGAGAVLNVSVWPPDKLAEPENACRISPLSRSIILAPQPGVTLATQPTREHWAETCAAANMKMAVSKFVVTKITLRIQLRLTILRRVRLR